VTSIFLVTVTPVAPPPELVETCELDPPATRVDEVAFAAKELADRLLEGGRRQRREHRGAGLVLGQGDVEPRERRVAIGTFDGVHVGHRAVIGEADTVLTFEPHPLRVIRPEAAPKLIMPFPIKRDVIEGIGVEELVVIGFDREFASIDPVAFCEEILIDKLGAAHVSVGENFRFGARAEGTPELLASRPEFETRVVPLVEVDGETYDVDAVRVDGGVRSLLIGGRQFVVSVRSRGNGRYQVSHAAASAATLPAEGATLFACWPESSCGAPLPAPATAWPLPGSRSA